MAVDIGEVPTTLAQLDLMKRLKAYGDGVLSWAPDGKRPNQRTREACIDLYSSLLRLEQNAFPLLARVNSKEMELFTLHDETHALKVAHLMWHILAPERRDRLTPAEIGLLVSSAVVHDLGMYLTNEEREAVLKELWNTPPREDPFMERAHEIKQQLEGEPDSARWQELHRALVLLEEAAICQANRAAHATPARYREVLDGIHRLHHEGSFTVFDPATDLSFDSDSFLDALIDVCASHGQSAEALVAFSTANPSRPVLPQDYPVGSSVADLRMVAAALRLADILDFDRDRTPRVLFHYLFPGTLVPYGDRSQLEWEKHLTISSWCLLPDTITFRGRCSSHIVHHAVVLFCELIAKEISQTKVVLEASGTWPFSLPTTVKADIFEQGYRYMPLQFTLDEARVYELFMGKALYPNHLDAVREIIQNAVDACLLRDALTRLNEPENIPRTTGRIVIEYCDSCSGHGPTLEIRDSGTGMDEKVIQEYLLKVGSSYYTSSEFLRTRAKLNQAGIDFAPVSEFGIGFLSVFLLCDKVVVETAMWRPVHGDTKKRTLEIDGPTRLIRYAEQENSGVNPFRGTSVRIYLSHGGYDNPNRPPSWKSILEYIQEVCWALPYTLTIVRRSAEGQEISELLPRTMDVDLPEGVSDFSVRIPVNDHEAGLFGEIVIANPGEGKKHEETLARHQVALPGEEFRSHSNLVRGGFRTGEVPGLPESYAANISWANLSLRWESSADRRYVPINVARSVVVNVGMLANHVYRIWLSWLLEHIDELPNDFLYLMDVRGISWFDVSWLEKYSALQVFRLATLGWYAPKKPEAVTEWESGEGSGLRLPSYEICTSLLKTVLPKVCRLAMEEQGNLYALPPSSEWKEILACCHDFVSKPTRWEDFALYRGSISGLLYYEYPGSDYLNCQFENAVRESFSEREVPMLVEVLRKVTATEQKRRAFLAPNEYLIFEKARTTLGSLSVGSIHGRWRIASFSASE